VTRRSDSTVWSFVLSAPGDLLHRFDGKPWAVRRSLKTRDLREANALARELQAEWSQRFDAMRREDNPQRVELNPVSDDYAHLTPAILRPVLERPSFPGLDLPQVFMTPSWRPALWTCSTENVTCKLRPANLPKVSGPRASRYLRSSV